MFMGKKPNKTGGKTRGFDFYLNKVALVVFSVLAILFVYTAVSSQMLPPLLIALLVVVVAIPVALVWWLSLRRGKAMGRAVGSVLAMVFCLLFAVGTRYIQIGMDALHSITKEEAETAAMCVYVRADDTREMEQLLDETFGVLGLTSSHTQDAVNQLNKEYSTSLTTQSFDAVTDLVDALNDEDVDAILVDQGQLSVLEDLEGYETAMDNLRQVKSFHVEVQSDNTPVPDDEWEGDSVVTVYISGSDSRDSNIMATGRSDVNIIATINTETHQVLLLNTPRDFYIPLARSGPNDRRDKLTHAGLYGVDESKDTLAQYYDIDIDYYFRVNFSGFEDIIDALGGIEVDSKYAFSSTISDTPIRYNKGINHLDGYEALYYVRERYSFPNGDYQRGVNQMQVIEAVMKKAMSPSILTSYTSLMQALSDCFKTSVPTELISSLVRNQLANPTQEWNIVTYYVSGTGSSEYTYSIPSQRAYVTIPDESTVETAKDLMQQVVDGKTISAPQQ